MQFNMNLGNRPVVSQSKATDDMIRKRIQEANASLKRQLVNAQRQRDLAVQSSASSESQLAFVKSELVKARQMITELEKKVKDATAALAEAASRKSRKEKKQEPQEIKEVKEVKEVKEQNTDSSSK